MANEDVREVDRQAIKQSKRRSVRKATVPNASAKLNFYQTVFSDEEQADLARAAEKDLADEIALLKVLIRRSLHPRQGEGDDNERKKQANGESVRRLVDTLCRAIRVQCYLLGKQDSEVEEATKVALAELTEELGIALDSVQQKGDSGNDAE